MITVISPAKKLDFKTKTKGRNYTTPEFLDKSAEIIDVIRQFSPKDLAVLMNVSDDIANLTFERHSKWKTPFNPENAKPAIHAFKGDVYRGMSADTFSREDLEFAQDHLRILSGLYGVLRPLDMIQPYRLEMGTKFKPFGGKNLYGFWTETITSAINENLKEHKEKVLVNLASQEYFKAIDKSMLEEDVVTPVFKEFKGNKYKVVGIHAKKARGMMCRFIIQNRIEKAEDMKLFNEEGYSYDDNLSNEREWIFTR
ncbi:MAG: peroxide stress protein YaaA [Bacteroidales bacterium]